MYTENLHCTGNEKSLEECFHHGDNYAMCNQATTVSVKCKGKSDIVSVSEV